MDSASSLTVEATIALLIQQYQKLPRGPYGVKQALEEAKTAGEDCLERLILNQSEPAWCAYFAVRKSERQGHGYAGKARLINSLNYIAAQPVEARRSFALKLAQAMDAEHVDDPVTGNKRRRSHLGEAQPILPLNLEIHPPMVIRESNEPFTGPINLDTSAMNQEPSDTVAYGTVFRGALFNRARPLFEDRLWDSIERMPNISTQNAGILSANVVMDFRQSEYVRANYGCEMHISIKSYMVTEIADEYFGIKIISDGNLRTIRHPGGSRADPLNSTKLRLARRSILNLFKGELYEAVCASPVCMRENEQDIRTTTEALFMTYSNRVHESGTLTVYLGEWKAPDLVKKIYI